MFLKDNAVLAKINVYFGFIILNGVYFEHQIILVFIIYKMYLFVFLYVM